MILLKQHNIDTTTLHMNEVLNKQQLQRQSDTNIHSWDCTLCSFHNEPYTKNCAMWHTSSPPHVLTYKSMSSLRFGLEIEIIITNGKRDGFTYQRLVEQWNSSISHTTTENNNNNKNCNNIPRVEFHGYSHHTTDSWKIVPDSSLRGQSDDDLVMELVSPILQGEDGLKQLRLVMDRLRSLGISTNTTCGFHIHVDATRGTDQAVSSMATLFGIQKIARCFLALENAFDLLVGLSWD